jgi:predicted MFS family arabinose efflux permease
MDPLYFRPEIAPDQFLPIFVVSTLVLVFGVGYAAIITLSKMGYFSKKWHPVGYLMWALQTLSLYELSVLIQSNHFTTKVLMVTMVAYLFIPHLYFYLIRESDKRYEETESSEQTTHQN